jgi:hypothetical protein
MNTNSRVGKRIGQLGLKLLNQSGSFVNELPFVHMRYYGFVGKIFIEFMAFYSAIANASLSGILFEPIQSVIEMHRKAVEVGCQIGNLPMEALHKIFQVAREFHAGTNLLKMKTALERDLKEEEYHESFPFLGRILNLYRQAVTTLICGSQPLDLVVRSNESLWGSEPSVSYHPSISTIKQLSNKEPNTSLDLYEPVSSH